MVPGQMIGIVITIRITPGDDGLFSLLSNAIVMVISIIFPGTMLRIELNGLKMNQLFGYPFICHSYLKGENKLFFHVIFTLRLK